MYIILPAGLLECCFVTIAQLTTPAVSRSEIQSGRHAFDVLILGGGFSGTMLAVQLLRKMPRLKIAVVDNREIPGRGLAYSTNCPSHLLNVPAGNMSALPDDPGHFVRWARESYRADV